MVSAAASSVVAETDMAWNQIFCIKKDLEAVSKQMELFRRQAGTSSMEDLKKTMELFEESSKEFCQKLEKKLSELHDELKAKTDDIDVLKNEQGVLRNEQDVIKIEQDVLKDEQGVLRNKQDVLKDEQDAQAEQIKSLNKRMTKTVTENQVEEILKQQLYAYDFQITNRRFSSPDVQPPSGQTFITDFTAAPVKQKRNSCGSLDDQRVENQHAKIKQQLESSERSQQVPCPSKSQKPLRIPLGEIPANRVPTSTASVSVKIQKSNPVTQARPVDK